MDVNFNHLTGFKRPHPSAEEEEEPHRAVRARPESARGQGCSTSGGSEPDGPLPALGNLSAWADSLPSFNFPLDSDWETPPASPTASMELSTIPRELPGEPAQGRDIAPAPPPASPVTSGALSAMIRELQGQPEALQDITTSVFRQESDAGWPASVFAGHATEGMEAFDLQGHLPMNRTGAALSRSQNAPMPQQAPRLPRGDEPDAPPSPMENLSAWADSLLSFNDSPASTEAQPADSMDAEALFAIQGQPVALQDATTSMSRQGSDAGQPVFAGDATGVDATHQGRQNLRQNLLHKNLLAARQRLTAGAMPIAAARELNIPLSTLANTFDRRGRLLINDRAKTLLQSRDATVAQQAQRLPRALTRTDLDKLTQALGDNAGREPRQLLTALQHAPTPIAKEALAFLVDSGGLRTDRLALLPDEQRQVLEAVHQGRQIPFQNPLHRNLLAARQRLAEGATATAAARELNIPPGTLTNTFDRHGHLIINNHGRRLLQSQDAQVARQARQLPRALTQVDLDKLAQALRDNAGREPSPLHTALRNLPNPVTQEALAFLVDAGGLRADRLALLPDEQRQALETAHQGRQSTLQNPPHRNLLAARQRMGEGATPTAAARELNIPQGTLTNIFDRHGRLLINDRAKTLLQSRDATVARQARQLPRALVRVDLNKLTRALRDNAGREPSPLHTALQNLPNPVAKEALEFLVDADGLRADRLALLPDEQRQLLEEARSVQDLI